jgi:hypothetical protein
MAQLALLAPLVAACSVTTLAGSDFIATCLQRSMTALH